MTRTYTIGEIKRLFNLETSGDAWELVISRGWEHVQPLPVTVWQITVPSEDLPNGETE